MKYRIVVSKTGRIVCPVLRDIPIVFDSYITAQNYFYGSVAVGNQLYYNVDPVG